VPGIRITPAGKVTVNRHRETGAAVLVWRTGWIPFRHLVEPAGQDQAIVMSGQSMNEKLHIVCPHCRSTNRVPADRLSERPKCGSCHEGLFTGHPIALTTRDFDLHVSRTDIPLVVDFWASWCGPCKMMAPAYDAAAKILDPQVRLAKVNTEEEQALAARFGIMSIPTLMIFRAGREVARQPGALGPQDIVRWVRSHV
jgi:thioredoxin 2